MATGAAGRPTPRAPPRVGRALVPGLACVTTQLLRGEEISVRGLG